MVISTVVRPVSRIPDLFGRFMYLDGIGLPLIPSTKQLAKPLSIDVGHVGWWLADI